MPAYDGVDPNPVMAPFFILFFGMMMADMGYGLLMIFLPLLYLKKARPPESKRGFIELILWCGIVTFIFGALTGGFFGDFIPQLCKVIDPASTFELPSLFSPLNDTMAIMIGSMVLGGIQILTGMTISVVKKTKDGHFADALWDEITWWVILAGGAMALLKVGSVAGVPVVLVIGVLMLVYGSGRGKKGFGKVTGLVSAVYNGVTGFFSDILSYVRLMALMLSGAVLAQAGCHHRERGGLRGHRPHRQRPESGAEPAGLLRPRYASAVSGIFRSVLQGGRQGLQAAVRRNTIC